MPPKPIEDSTLKTRFCKLKSSCCLDLQNPLLSQEISYHSSTIKYILVNITQTKTKVTEILYIFHEIKKFYLRKKTTKTYKTYKLM